MSESKHKALERAGYVLIILMVLLQGLYAIYAYVDPASFAILRGTDLVVPGDTDWVKIYASRTLFVSLIIGYLLYIKNYKVLMWASLFGAVMPITDAFLAFEANAENKIVYKHLATLIYLLLTFFVLSLVVKNRASS
jgi:hypothetical protein